MGNCTSSASSKLTPVFTNTKTEYYRIPALIYIKDTQTFLAFAEKRKSLNDVDAECLVIRRKTRQQTEWSSAEEITNAHRNGYRTMNPCPVYYTETKTVFLFFNCVLEKVTEQQQIHQHKNAARLCYVKSTDSGGTWKDFRDLTDTVIGDKIENWATFSVGPGHGIQMTDGRLIIPAYVYYFSKKSEDPNPYSFVFYSDDRGVTWKFGHRLNVKSGECQMAEITESNGQSSLYCNARCTGGNRIEVFSQNRGENFDSNSQQSSLVETDRGCQGSVVSFKQGNDTWLLYSHPSDKKERKDLGVYVNKCPFSDKGWSEPHIINRGPSGYSDLTRISDTGDRVACLLERGTSKLEEIAFVEFSLKDIMPN